MVIALLSALVGVLLPLLHHYRTEASRTVCHGHLGRIIAAVGAYAEEHGGRLPLARPMPRPVAGPDSLPALARVVGPRVNRSAYAFHCPGDRMTLYPLCGSSYYYDTMAAFRSGGVGGLVSASPSRTPLLWDCDDLVLRVLGRAVSIPPFHGERVVAHVDGHVGEARASLPPPFGR